MPSHHPLIRPQQAYNKNGFALVIALSSMAFVLLLVLTLSTLIRVESQSSQTSLHRTEAKQNALLAINIALGNLQKLGGSDLRITASAEIFDQNAAGTPVDVENNNWVGVWDSDPGIQHLNDRLDNTSTYYDYTDRRNPNSRHFLGWLVSGDYTQLADCDQTIPVNDELEIFGADFDPNDLAQVENQTKVAKVGISSLSRVTGHYAFWVSEQNTKARIDGYNAIATTPSPSNVTRSRFIINQRNAIEKVASQNDVFIHLQPTSPSLAAFTYPSDLLFTIPAANQADALTSLQQNADGLTTHSYSLLTDSYTSGLKTDLSALLRNAGIAPLNLPLGVIGFNQGGSNALAKYPSSNGANTIPAAPTWDQLKSFFDTQVVGTTPVEARKHTETTHGLYPLITRFRLDMRPFFIRSSAPTIGDEFLINLAPGIVMTNPYNIPLRIPADMRVHFFFEKRDRNSDRGLFITNDWIKIINGSNRVETFNGDLGRNAGYAFGRTDVHNVLDNSLLDEFVAPDGIEYVAFTFRMPADEVVLDPGEVTSFGIAITEDENLYNGDNRLEEGLIEINPSRVRLPNLSATGLELRASTTWSQLSASAATSYAEQGGLHFNVDAAASHSAPSRLTPFNVAIGMSDSGNDNLALPDFFQFVGNIESSNPNAIQANISSFGGRNARPPVLGTGFNDQTAMEQRGLRFDVAVSGGFQYASNNRANNEGYRINNRWLVGHNFRAPIHQLTVADDPTTAINTLYGSISGYAPGADLGQQMHVPAIQLSTSNSINAYWGTAIDITGLETTSFFDLPRQGIGLLSIGQLQHMLISETTSAHLYGIGGGIANLKIGDTGDVVLNGGFSNPVTSATIPIDQSFILNDALWDSYFFSGLQQDLTSGELGLLDSVPLNERYRISDNATPLNINDSRQTAADIYVEGGFNINSTDVEAWKAVIAGGNALNIAPSGGAVPQVLSSPLTRTGFPLANSGNSDLEKLNGFRELTDVELDSLAAAIVVEVKERGPFLSLADFVNRRLEPGNRENALYGALEAAIRNSEINDGLTNVNNGQPLSEYTLADLPSGRSKPTSFITEIFEGSQSEGTQQWISQADILQRIGPIITARSDSFIITAYGDSLNQINGKPRASALCEAIVQRTYEYVDASDSPTASVYGFDNTSERYVNDSLSTTNAAFGRKYKIISIRWL